MTALFIFLTLMTAAALCVLLIPLLRDTSIEPIRRKRTALCVSTLFMTVTLGLYAWVGAPRIIDALDARQERLNELKNEIVTNLQKVKSSPNDLGAWVVLGTDFLETGQIDSAVAAFKQAVLLSNGDPALVLAYAKAQVMQADGKVTEDAAKGFNIVLMLKPENPDARYFMALYDLQNGKTQQAMQAMKTLYHSLPDDSPLKDMIDRQIGRK